MMDQNFHLWWTRNSDKNLDLIPIAMNAHDYMMDKKFDENLDMIFTAMNAHEIIWWTKISDKNSDLIFTAMNAHEILNYDGLKFLTSIRVWPLQQWMLMKLSDKLFHFDMLWFSKRRPTRSRHDDLKFSNLQCPRKIVCQSLNRNLWYHLILLKLEKWCFLIPSEMEPMPNSRAC